MTNQSQGTVLLVNRENGDAVVPTIRDVKVFAIVSNVNCRTDVPEVLRYLFGEKAVKVAVMHDEFPVFETFLNKRRRGWAWRVCTAAGDVVMGGSEGSRHAANYKAYRALFLLLQTVPYRLIRLSSAEGAISTSSSPGNRPGCFTQRGPSSRVSRARDRSKYVRPRV